MSGKRLLVVDDAMLMRRLIRDVAAEAGWEVAGEAKNGAEAVELYRSLRPDLVTMDVVMPQMGGLEALRLIRAEDPQARIVMVTARSKADADGVDPRRRDGLRRQAVRAAGSSVC